LYDDVRSDYKLTPSSNNNKELEYLKRMEILEEL